MARHIQTGKEGEALARKFFEERNYQVLSTNWKYRHWEIDIIASRENRLHFIEVKTRRGNSFGHPEENVTPKKMQYLLNAADEYLFQNPGWKRVQFDVLAITLLKDDAPEYFLIEDVYV